MFSGLRSRCAMPAAWAASRGQPVPLLGEVAVQRHAVEQLHQVVLPAVGEAAEREDVDDIAVPDLVYRARLGDEARHDLRVARELAVERLDRAPLADERVEALVNGPESTLAQLALDAVLADHVTGP
jgi:hypothetical protein